MDNAVERRSEEAGRRQVVRSAQRSDTNVYLFRRLKWGWPRLDRHDAKSGGLRIVDILLLVVIASLLGYSALMLMG